MQAHEARGLSSAEAAHRLAELGPNVVPVARPPSVARLLAHQLTHFFALLLWGAAGLAWAAQMPQLALAIVVVVVVNGLFAFGQEYRADRAGQRLQELVPAVATVRRDGRHQQVAAPDLVPGDLLVLEAGDRVPADACVERGAGLAVDESMLTGESAPVRGGSGAVLRAGTFVVEGEALATVTATGPSTRLAEIAALTRSAVRPPSPLAVRLSGVVRVIAVIAVVTGAVLCAVALGLGMSLTDGFLFALGATVALVPEGLLPTVTLSLARAAQSMAADHALVRRLESVETLGSTTFICTDKTGTLTCNEMSAVEVWTPAAPDSPVSVVGDGYVPHGRLLCDGQPVDATLRAAVRAIGLAGTRCVRGRVARKDGRWVPHGDPTEVALHVLAVRAGAAIEAEERVRPVLHRVPFDARRRRSSAVTADQVLVLGAPESVFACLAGPAPGAAADIGSEMARRGLRVLAVAQRATTPADRGAGSDVLERGLALLGLVGLEDPPRQGVLEAVAACRTAGIRLAVVTGDAPATAAAIAREVGVLRGDAPVLEGRDLPADDAALGALVDTDGVVVARVTPEDKLRIARALRARGHVVAMTGDGVNDGPALREADIGVAMGRSGTDVAREAADLVLLDDHFATVVRAVELGRATFANIRRFLTYHLTDNVAELTPFVVWALSGGRIPLALVVLQVLALDIGTDLLPALALGAERPAPDTLRRLPATGALVDRALLVRVFGVLGPAEAAVEMGAFLAVLVAGGWVLGAVPGDALLATASGAAFAAVVLGQAGNALACRSERRWAGRLDPRTNPLLLAALAVEVAMLVAFLLPPLALVLGGSWPTPLGWALALLAPPAVIAADAAHKAVRRG